MRLKCTIGDLSKHVSYKQLYSASKRLGSRVFHDFVQYIFSFQYIIHTTKQIQYTLVRILSDNFWAPFS